MNVFTLLLNTPYMQYSVNYRAKHKDILCYGQKIGNK